MTPRFLTLWEKLHTSFWFVPSVIIAAVMALAAGTLAVDDPAREKEFLTFPFIFRDGVEGARGLLAAIASSVMTVTGVTFSVTIVALTLASSQFTPRLLRNFMRDTGNQVVLGILIATFTYCLAILRVVGGPSGDFVPRISVTCAIALTFLSIGALVYFIHHTASLIQAQSIIAKIGRELDQALDEVYPEDVGTSAPEHAREELPPDFSDQAARVCSTRSDYLEAVDGDSLMALAEKYDLILSLDRRPGDFIGEDEILARVYPGERANPEITEKVRDAFILAPQRTQTQDLEFSLSELVEIAVRALSPGINDPMTAAQCVDRLGSVLAKVAARPAPSTHRYGRDGQLRIVAKHYAFRGLAAAAFNQIRQYARSSAPVTIRLLEAIRIIAHHIRRKEDREALLHHATMIDRGAKEGLPEPSDQDDVHERFREIVQILERRAGREAQP